MAYGQASALTRKKWKPNLSEATLSSAPSALYAAQIRDANLERDAATAESNRQFEQSMSLEREKMDKQKEDSKRANLIALGGTVVSNPRVLDTVFSDSAKPAATDFGAPGVDGTGGFAGTESSANPSGLQVADSIDAKPNGLLFDGSEKYGLTGKGLGHAGIGAVAGGLIGGNDLEKSAIGAGVPLALNVGQAIMSGGSIMGSVSSSMFPSLAGALGSLLF